MKSELTGFIDMLIAWSFYAIFFLVPLVIFSSTFELFEFNKMWVVFGISLFIFLLWSTKAIATKQLIIRRTPLDIPLLLFLLSQIISTIFSLDQHVSWWGYYSRFNGGLLSIICYIFLYYAYAGNCVTPESAQQNHPKRNISYKLLLVSLFSGIAVTVWGLPSHFGYDPTCLLFRGSLDVSCWTDAFQPKARIFSTLGQPNWLGTYMGALIPILIGAGLVLLKKVLINKNSNERFLVESKGFLIPIIYLVLLFFFLLALIYSDSKSSFAGLLVGVNVFFTLLFFFTLSKHKLSLDVLKNKRVRYLILANIIITLVPFFFGTPFKNYNKFTTFDGITKTIFSKFSLQKNNLKTITGAEKTEPPPSNLPFGGSDSGEIRSYVWTGAIEIFKKNPLFGTGVETFAYAYYKEKPRGHNNTSEWDYLYNKAHNEYLNYLATTGIFGLLTYLSFIALFLFHAVKYLLKRGIHTTYFFPLSVGLLGSFVVVLISNYFGFSVVIVNLFLFLIPILFYDLEYSQALSKKIIIGNKESQKADLSSPQKLFALSVVGVFFMYCIFYLFNFWRADQKYSLGYNLNRAQEYAQAYKPLSEAVSMLPGEPVYKDEFSITLSALALLLSQQKQDEQAKSAGKMAKALSDEITSAHPNNIVFLKSRTRVFYTLSQFNPSFLDLAFESINKAKLLAPTDAKITYNLALFYNQKNDFDKSIQYFNEAISLKPNYVDARYGLALYYSQAAKTNSSQRLEFNKKAVEQLEYILKNVDPIHSASKKLLFEIK